MAEKELLSSARPTTWSNGPASTPAGFPGAIGLCWGERIERGMYELLEVLIQAKYSRDRQELLRRAT